MCINPRILHYKGQFWQTESTIGNAKTIQVPCGKCIECKIQYQNHWYIRLYEESKQHKHFIFFTLTYKESAVPFYVDKETGVVHRSVHPQHVQCWIKRFRTRYVRSYGNSANFKYFITSEYGPRTLRPHLHGVLLGLSRHESAPLFNEWRKLYGFVNVRYVSSIDVRNRQNKIRYITKYCSKGEYENPKVNLGLVHKTFHLISKRIGYGYIDRMRKWHLQSPFRRLNSKLDYNVDYLDSIIDKRFYHLNGFRYSLPRYYKTKIYGEQSRLSTAIANRIQSRLDDAYNTELEQLQAERNCTFIEADNILRLRETQLHNQRYRKAKERYEAFLNKSQL